MALKLRLDYICVDRQDPPDPYLSEDAFNRSWRLHPLKSIELIYADYELNDSDVLSFKITKGSDDTWKIFLKNILIDHFSCSEQDLFLSILKASLIKNADKLPASH